MNSLLLVLVFASGSLAFYCPKSDFCPGNSCLFLVNPKEDGSCPTYLPEAHSKEEENQNPCVDGSAEPGLKKCGLCMEFGPQGAQSLPMDSAWTSKCKVSCLFGRPMCDFKLTKEAQSRGWFSKLWKKAKKGIKKFAGGINGRLCTNLWGWEVCANK